MPTVMTGCGTLRSPAVPVTKAADGPRGRHAAIGLREVVRGAGRPGRLHCASDPRWGQRLPAGVQALDLDLLTAHLVVHGLDVVCAGHAQPDFLDDTRRLVYECLLGGLDDFDRAVRPVDVPDIDPVGDRPAQELGVLFMQGYICRDLTLRHEAADAGLTGLDHTLADFQLLLGEAQHFLVRPG